MIAIIILTFFVLSVYFGIQIKKVCLQVKTVALFQCLFWILENGIFGGDEQILRARILERVA